MTTERDFIYELAQSYVEQGLTAVIEPRDSVLPDFLKGTRIDLLVQGPNESIVFEVTSRADVRSKPTVARLAALLDSKPGWRFEVVMLPPRDEPVAPRERSLSRSQGQVAVAEARGLYANHPTAALLLAWSGTEAILRQLAGDAGVVADRGHMPRYLLDALHAAGVIDAGARQILEQVMAARNAAAHGFTSPSVALELFDEFLAIVERIGSAG